MLLSKKEQHKTPLQTVIEDLKDGFCTIEKDGGFPAKLLMENW